MDINKHKIQIPDGNDPNNPIRIYSDGVFDCFHFGHARLFEQIKKAFKHVYLIVGVTSDADTINFKGKILMTEKERAECISHCKWVDEIVHDCPWMLTWEFIDKRNIHLVAHDPIPYKYGDIDDLYGEFKVAVRFFATKRTEAIYTTDLIVRVIKEYDEFTLRSFERGLDLKELNIDKTVCFIIDYLKKDNSDFSINLKKSLIEKLNQLN